MNNKKRIDYAKVAEVASNNLSERNAVKMLAAMGIKISNAAYHKFKSEQSYVADTEEDSKVSTAEDSKVSTSENSKVSTSDSLTIQYGVFTLRAYSHVHRDYRKDGLSKENLYEVVGGGQYKCLEDYQFTDLFQLQMAKINPRYIYNWRVRRCILNY